MIDINQNISENSYFILPPFPGERFLSAPIYNFLLSPSSTILTWHSCSLYSRATLAASKVKCPLTMYVKQPYMGSCLLSGGLFFFCLRLCLTPKPLAVKSVTHICIGNLTTCHNARPWLLSSAENLVCCPSRPQVKTSRSKAMISHSLIINRKYWFTALSIQFALDWGMYFLIHP